MPNGVPFCTRFVNDNIDLGKRFVEKDYLIDVYPCLSCNLKASVAITWGQDSSGSMARNGVICTSPFPIFGGGHQWVDIRADGNTGAGLKADGTLWVWGSNFGGRLGDLTSISKSSPVQTVSSGNNWAKVRLGNHAAAIKTDGTLWLWGNSNSGALGNNLFGLNDRSSPVQTVSGGTNWLDVKPGSSMTVALKIDGTLWNWGDGSRIATNNSSGTTASPAQTISGGNNWKHISAGNYAQASIKTDGTLWLWGYNLAGILGDNTTISRSSPVQTISSGTNWRSINTAVHSIAIKTDGTLWMWGCGNQGRLGNNSTINISSPVQTISGGVNWKISSIGGSSAVGISMALKVDGTLWVWGWGANANLGDGSFVNKSSPVQTIVRGTNWKMIAQNNGSGAAIREEGDW